MTGASASPITPPAPARRRGACPSLSAPMATGDGLLVRLATLDRSFTPAQFAAVAEAAGACGNGLLEITGRGSLQIRGLTEASAPALAERIAGLDLAVGGAPAIEVGPLAGLAAGEIADPRPLAIRLAAVARPLADRFAPKMQITIDGGGPLTLGGIPADVALTAVAPDLWQVAVAGSAGPMRVLGVGAPDAAIAAAFVGLRTLADGGRGMRGRDLPEEALAACAAGLVAHHTAVSVAARAPIGRFALKDGATALGVALAFGQASWRDLLRFAQAAAAARDLRLAPGRGMLVVGLDAAAQADLAAIAADLGFITEPEDPRLAIVACAGAPQCASAHLDTRALARELAAEHGTLFDGSFQLQLSGCAKQCAAPAGPTLTLLAGPEGCSFLPGPDVPAGLRDLVLRRAARHSVMMNRQPRP